LENKRRMKGGIIDIMSQLGSLVAPNGTEMVDKTKFNQKMGTMPVIDINKDLSALVKAQMLATPDAVALEDDTGTWTYSLLDEKVEALATHLRDHGVCRDTLVGVLLGRSGDYIIACLAALRAGGAFLVLELAYPPGLLADVIDDAKPVVIVTNTAHIGQIKADIPLIVLNDQSKTVKNLKERVSLPADNDLDRLAFVSYSSGTTYVNIYPRLKRHIAAKCFHFTQFKIELASLILRFRFHMCISLLTFLLRRGRPKGIANPHRAPVLSYDLRFRLSDLGPGDRVACNVFFIWEILRPYV